MGSRSEAARLAVVLVLNGTLLQTAHGLRPFAAPV
jgi:hypothetical protein